MPLLSTYAGKLLNKWIYGSWDLVNKDGESILSFDSFLELEFDNQNSITDYAVEQGSFSSIQKTIVPYSLRVILVKSNFISIDTELEKFTNKCNELAKDTNLYTILTPKKTYTNANIVGVNWAEKQETGTNRVIVEFLIKEIREVQSQKATGIANPKNSENASTQKVGQMSAVERASLDVGGL